MWLKWFPWRFLVSRLARSYGFLDPIQWLTRMRRFAHPAEVTEPVELLRAGVLFHARGLINTKAIQHNLDWIWPYWVERQFNPSDDSFIPRAFSFSHINLTHRNWTAVGLPDVPFYPIVDPRGLLTPYHDGWSIDFWLVGPDNHWLLPSKLNQAEQRLETGSDLRLHSRFTDRDWELKSTIFAACEAGQALCVAQLEANAPRDVFLAAVVRPYNPEGISFIDSIRIGEEGRRWRINDEGELWFNRAPDKCFVASYRQGDVAHAVEQGVESNEVVCPVSMASGAALFSLPSLNGTPLEIRIPLINEVTRKAVTVPAGGSTWPVEMARCSRLRVPDRWFQELYDIAVSSLILHAPGEVYPGPYTYKRFWYRDAAFILHALVTLGALDRTGQALELFPRGQTLSGYFRSQEGEWDSNGEVLWIMERFLRLAGRTVPEAWQVPIEKGARWILNRRLAKDSSEPHAGLLPAGFSAEHLGPNDYYYWDNFWGVAGLRAAARMLESRSPRAAAGFAEAAEEYWQTIVGSFRFIAPGPFKNALPASPHRRMDAGAIGSLVADYPLQLFPPGHERMLRTVEYLMAHSSFAGGFFQNMIHSGINAYLTLHLAQVLLRAGDPRASELIDTVARLATSTGQWPEAIHPKTGGGCMGDGQHIWAAAEWALIIRNLFVREEGHRLVLGSGLFQRWLEQSELMSFGPTLTPFGPVSLSLEPESTGSYRIQVQADWRDRPPPIEIKVPAHSRVRPLEAPNCFLVQTDV